MGGSVEHPFCRTDLRMAKEQDEGQGEMTSSWRLRPVAVQTFLALLQRTLASSHAARGIRTLTCSYTKSSSSDELWPLGQSTARSWNLAKNPDNPQPRLYERGNSRPILPAHTWKLSPKPFGNQEGWARESHNSPVKAARMQGMTCSSSLCWRRKCARLPADFLRFLQKALGREHTFDANSPPTMKSMQIGRAFRGLTGMDEAVTSEPFIACACTHTW